LGFRFRLVEFSGSDGPVVPINWVWARAFAEVFMRVYRMIL